MRKEKNLQLLLIGVLSIVVAGMSIGFAAYSQSLNISSSTNIQPSVWRVEFNTEQVTGCNEESGTGTISSVSLTDSTISFDVDLDNIGDYVEYNACVDNEGTLDAELTSVTLPTLTAAQKKYIKVDYGYGVFPQSSYNSATYTLNYNSIQSGTSYDLATPLSLDVGDRHSFIIRIEYIQPDDPDDLPSVAETINISTTLNYDQT